MARARCRLAVLNRIDLGEKETMSQEDKKVSAALGLLRRLSESMVLASVVDGELSLWETTIALEIMSSLNRRQVRDSGISREQYREVAADAQGIAEKIYEDSGLGQRLRRDTALREEAKIKDESGFSKEQWAKAAEAASAAIADAMRGEN